MDFIVFVLVFVAVVGAVWYGVKKWEEAERKQEEEERRQLRELSMAYLRNHAGSAVGLAQFLYESHFGRPHMTPEQTRIALAAAQREAELALAQYRSENPLDVEIPREPSFRKPPDGRK